MKIKINFPHIKKYLKEKKPTIGAQNLICNDGIVESKTVSPTGTLNEYIERQKATYRINIPDGIKPYINYRNMCGQHEDELKDLDRDLQETLKYIIKNPGTLISSEKE